MKDKMACRTSRLHYPDGRPGERGFDLGVSDRRRQRRAIRSAARLIWARIFVPTSPGWFARRRTDIRQICRNWPAASGGGLLLAKAGSDPPQDQCPNHQHNSGPEGQWQDLLKRASQAKRRLTCSTSAIMASNLAFRCSISAASVPLIGSSNFMPGCSGNTLSNSRCSSSSDIGHRYRSNGAHLRPSSPTEVASVLQLNATRPAIFRPSMPLILNPNDSLMGTHQKAGFLTVK